jgi:hypothetical protein
MAPKYVSTIVSQRYDEKNDQTTCTVLPFGSLPLPGKWTKTTYIQSSGQQNFENKDRSNIALLINRNSDYPFYKKGMSANTFVKDMYRRDSDYFVLQYNARCSIIKQDTSEHYIIWQIIAQNEKHKFDIIYLAAKMILFLRLERRQKAYPFCKKLNLCNPFTETKTLGFVVHSRQMWEEEKKSTCEPNIKHICRIIKDGTKHQELRLNVYF